VANLLDRIGSLAGDTSLARGPRMSIAADLDRIQRALTGRVPGAAVAVFACSGRGLFEQVVLPRSVRDRIVVDGSPWVRPLHALLDEYPRCGVVVVHGARRRAWELAAGELRPAHGRDVDPGRYDVLVVGGAPAEVAAYLAGLPVAVRGKVAATFDLEPATTTVAEISRLAVPLAAHHEAESQRQRVSEVFTVYDSGGPAVLGLEPCLQAASVGAVRALMVEDAASATGVVCEACGWLGRHGPACAACACPVRHSDDVIDELIESVVDQGGTVRRIRVDTALRGWTVAASLHFAPHGLVTDVVELVTTGRLG
jgi:peptide chain release factor subunit 1